MVVLACLFTCVQCGRRACKWHEARCPACRVKFPAPEATA